MDYTGVLVVSVRKFFSLKTKLRAIFNEMRFVWPVKKMFGLKNY